MLENWDYLVIGLYLLFTMSIGVVCRKVAKNSSDFFRGGGNMLWWMTGMSGLASGLSGVDLYGGGHAGLRHGIFHDLSLLVVGARLSDHLLLSGPALPPDANYYGGRRHQTPLRALYRAVLDLGADSRQYDDWCHVADDGFHFYERRSRCSASTGVF